VTATSTAPRYPQRWVLLTAVGMAAFITSLDNTVLNVALPTLQADLGLTLTGLQWVGTSYILAFSSLLLVGGRLTDLYGRRNTLVAGMTIFTVASVLAGLAPNGTFLIFARVLQGVGGALVLPSTLLVLATDLDADSRHLGVGVWTAAIASAIALGPVVGGLILQVAPWGWIFFINLPIGVAAIALVIYTVSSEAIVERTPTEIRQQLDLPGLAYSAISLFAFTFVLIHGQDHGFTAPAVVISLVASVVCGFLFIRHERGAKHALVDLSLFKGRTFSGGTVVQVIWGLGINGVLFFTSLFLQDILGLSPFDAGLVYVPLALSIAIMVPIGAAMANRFGANITVAIGMVVIAFGLFLGLFVGADDSPARFLVGLIIVGLGSGLTTPMTSAVIDVVPNEQGGIGAAVISTAREVSGVFGIAAIGAVLVLRSNAATENGASESGAFMAGYHLALGVAAAIILIGAAVSLWTLTTRQQAIDMKARKEAEEAAAEAAGEAPADETSELLESTTSADIASAIGEAVNVATGHDAAGHQLHGHAAAAHDAAGAATEHDVAGDDADHDADGNGSGAGRPRESQPQG
jgi:EmrB/QacA subfamily drug resistance transporter